MDFDALNTYLEALPGVTSGHPFGPEHRVYKVLDKMFAALPEGAEPIRLNLKCEPEFAEELRRRYTSVLPGYHMNKRHWNTVVLEGELSQEQLLDLVDHSWELVVRGLRKRDREPLLAARGSVVNAS